MKTETKTNYKCPKCKSRNLFLIEVWKDHAISWLQENGIVDVDSSNIEMGNPYKVEAECNKCHHRWTLQKVYQLPQFKP
jgi:Zn finger protein HypA/HybF involved in hydrogenase expression